MEISRKDPVTTKQDATATSVHNPNIKSPARGNYPVEDLCRRHTFEQVAYLRWHGDLPAHEKLWAQNRAERAHRASAWDIVAPIAGQPLTDNPVDTLRTAVKLIGAHDAARDDASPAAIDTQALRLYAVVPAVIAMDQRLRNGLGGIAPSDHLGYAANFLYMTFGKVPEPQIVAAFETSLILYTEHTVKADPRATASRPDFYHAVTATIGAFTDTPHASAGKAVMEMMNEVAIPDNAGPWLAEALDDGRKIAGFGHHDDQEADSRVSPMRAALGMVAALRGGQELLEISDTLADVMYRTTGLPPNLDYPASLAYHLTGFDTATFTLILIAACLPGWTADISAQLSRRF